MSWLEDCYMSGRPTSALLMKNTLIGQSRTGQSILDLRPNQVDVTADMIWPVFVAWLSCFNTIIIIIMDSATDNFKHDQRSHELLFVLQNSNADALAALQMSVVTCRSIKIISGASCNRQAVQIVHEFTGILKTGTWHWEEFKSLFGQFDVLMSGSGLASSFNSDPENSPRLSPWGSNLCSHSSRSQKSPTH